MLLIVIGIVLSVANPFRFDFAGGTHRITPTAVDTDLWGNYKVYYKTSDFTHNATEDFYYINKEDKYLADQAGRAITSKNEIIVYYDRYIGYKGFTAPKTSPIVRIETIRVDHYNGKGLTPKQINLLKSIYGKGGNL